MKLIKRIVIKVFFALSKIFLPKKYFDVIYISELLQSKKLNRPELRKRIWCFLHGFLPYEYVWYDLANNDYKSYVPARNNYQKRLLNGSFNAILANKLLFENHIKTIISGIDKLHVVESIGFIEDGYLQPLHKNIIP